MKAVNLGPPPPPNLSGNICPLFGICPTRGTCPFHAPKPSISKVYYNHLSPFRDFVFHQTCNSQEIPPEKAPVSGSDSYIVQLSLSSLTIFQSLSKCRTKYLVRRHSTFDPSSVPHEILFGKTSIPAQTWTLSLVFLSPSSIIY